MFALFSIYLIRIFGGVTEAISGPPPMLLLALTGISFATPFASNIISAIRYPKADVPEVEGVPKESRVAKKGHRGEKCFENLESQA